MPADPVAVSALCAQGGGDRDGLPTIARIRRLFAALGAQPPPIVVLSGEGDADAQAQFLDAGAARVIRKPASLDALKQLRLLVTGGGVAGTTAGTGIARGSSVASSSASLAATVSSSPPLPGGTTVGGGAPTTGRAPATAGTGHSGAGWALGASMDAVEESGVTLDD